MGKEKGLVYYLANRYQISALQKPFAAVAVGTLFLMLISLIPYIGAIVTGVAAEHEHHQLELIKMPHLLKALLLIPFLEYWNQSPPNTNDERTPL